MRKIIRTTSLDWETDEMFRGLLDVSRLPEFLIIETVEEE